MTNSRQSSQFRQILINYLRLMRIHRPIPILLLSFPILILIFSQFLSDIRIGKLIDQNYLIIILKITIITIFGSFIVRSLGCVINDFFDKDVDLKTERVKIRPLVDETSLAKPTNFGISILCGILSAISFSLAVSLGKIPFLLSLMGAFLISLYPLSKRFFLLPQLFLGLTYNFGIIIIGSSVDSWLNGWSGFFTILFFFIIVLWTFAYDTVYGMQDIEDDKKNDLYSTSILLENNLIPIVRRIYNLIFILLVLFSFLIGGKIFFLAIVLSSLQCKDYLNELKKTRNYQKFFEDNWKLFGILLMGVLLDLGLSILTFR